MELTIIQKKPFGISVIPIDGINRSNYLSKIEDITKDISDFRNSLQIDTLVRGTSYDNLYTVLATGVDVVPSNAPIFCTQLVEKAMEYGWDGRNNPTRIILSFYKRAKTKRTFMEISSDTPKNKIENLKKIYPIVDYSTDGRKIFLSRLKESDTRRNTEYELEYGYWIPENPLNALVCLFLLGSFTLQEIDDLREQVNSPENLNQVY